MAIVYGRPKKISSDGTVELNCAPFLKNLGTEKFSTDIWDYGRDFLLKGDKADFIGVTDTSLALKTQREGGAPRHRTKVNSPWRTPCASKKMKKLKINHPYFQAIECDESQCWVTLNKQFPIKGFRVALVEPLSNYIEVGSDVGFLHADGEIDWFYGHGETIEEATEMALQNFLNLVVHPDNLTSDNFVKREEIA